MAIVSNDSTVARDLGLLFMRVGIGLIFIAHGWPKLMGGIATWQWLGSQMSLVGISFLPAVWGFLAASAELVGGVCLIAGFATRGACAALSCVMAIALIMHLHQGDAFSVSSHPLSLLVVFIGFIIAGAGTYSIDHYLS